MSNPFAKAWNYLMALFDSKIDEKADPKIQIEQAIGAAEKQHQELAQQAAAVIGNQRQLEMQLNRQLAAIERLQANTRQALTLAKKATAAGDAKKAQEYNNAAESFAAQLVQAEKAVEGTKKLHDQALKQATEAKRAVKRNEMQLKEQVARRTQLLSQLEQAKMQEKVSASLKQMNSLTANSNAPSLDQVRDKIEQRYAKALGQAELAQDSVGSRMAEVEEASMQLEGHSRLEAIRAEMESGQDAVAAGGQAQAITGGDAADEVSPEVAAKLKELRGE